MAKSKKREWKWGEKHGIKGTVRAAITHHPDKFDADCKDPDRLCPYAVFTAKKKKEDFEPHYKNQESTKKGMPHKKTKFKEWMEQRELNEGSITRDVIDQVLDYLEKHSYYDDEFSVAPLLQQLNLSPLEMERIIGLINQRLPLQDPIGDPSYDFNPYTLKARYSSADI